MRLSVVAIIFFFQLIDVFGYTILLDPGHGGEDRGAIGAIYKRVKGKRKLIRRYYEKDLTLIYAKKIREKLLLKKYSVFLSRSYDSTISLEKRSEIAEKVKADIFISIHMNSSKRARSSGFELYYLDNHNDAAVKKVEDLENIGLKGDELVISQILTDLIVERTVKSSKKLANIVYKSIEKNIFKKYSIKGRGIRPGLFYVLALSKRPGILLEIGFMSNQMELKKLLSSRFQDSMVNALVAGIDNAVIELIQ